jgi:hypothetical protein
MNLGVLENLIAEGGILSQSSGSIRSSPLFRSAVPVGQPYIFIRTFCINKPLFFAVL